MGAGTGRTGCADRQQTVYSSAAQQMWKLSRPSDRLPAPDPPTLPPSVKLLAVKPKRRPVTFDNVAVDRPSEVIPGLLVEVLAVDDPHLFEESRLAALARAQQQDLHQPLHVDTPENCILSCVTKQL
uniref:Uncharacterized protein n=1 Tax=Cyprinodon variegatus TaxID=28743 RepID=A0A3Q2CQG0_CYPVA